MSNHHPSPDNATPEPESVPDVEDRTRLHALCDTTAVATVDLRPFPVRANAAIADLDARLTHLERIVHRYINGAAQ